MLLATSTHVQFVMKQGPGSGFELTYFSSVIGPLGKKLELYMLKRTRVFAGHRKVKLSRNQPLLSNC